MTLRVCLLSCILANLVSAADYPSELDLQSQFEEIYAKPSNVASRYRTTFFELGSVSSFARNYVVKTLSDNPFDGKAAIACVDALSEPAKWENGTPVSVSNSAAILVEISSHDASVAVPNSRDSAVQLFIRSVTGVDRISVLRHTFQSTESQIVEDDAYVVITVIAIDTPRAKRSKRIYFQRRHGELEKELKGEDSRTNVETDR